MTKYRDDLQKSAGFSGILNRKQSIEFRFKDTIFILSKNCLSRQSLDKNAQSLCQSDYEWFLESMAIHLIGNKVRSEAENQGLNIKEVDVAQIIQDICGIDPAQQGARQPMGIYSSGVILKIHAPKLEKFIFNAKYLLDRFQFILPGRNSDNLVSRLNHAVNSEIEKRKKLEPEESNFFTSLNRDHHSQSLPETQPAISSVLQTDININTPLSISHRSTESFNWKLISSIPVGGIGIIVFIVAFIIWFSKKNRSQNSELGITLFIHSIEDNLHVRKLVDRLGKRLGFLKNLDRYADEIGSHYISFCSVKSKEEAIEDLNKMKKALTKFIPIKEDKLKNKDKILSNKLESALLIVESLMQRYSLLSLPNINSSKNNHISDQLKFGLKGLINSMLDNIEIIRDNFEGDFFSKHNIKKDVSKLIYLDLLLNLEKAIYETMLSAQAEGYFEKYPRELIKNCLNLNILNINTNPVVNNEIDLKNIKELQGDLLSTIGFILNPSQTLEKELLKLKEDALYNAIHSFIKQLECIKSQLIAYFADYNARREVADKLKPMQSSDGSFNSTFFVQQPSSPQISQSTQGYTMHMMT